MASLPPRLTIASAPKTIKLAKSATTVCSATVIKKIQLLEEIIIEDLGMHLFY